MPPPPPTPSYTPATATLPPLDSSMALAEKLMPSFVAIDFYLPYLVDGMKATQFYGTGFIVSTNPPLIVCDRDTIPISLGDILITFANSVIIPGKLLFLHPFFNFVILSYDPSLIGDTPVKPIEFSDQDLNQGDEVHFTGIGGDHSISTKKTTVSSITNIGTRECSPPRWRAMNVEGVKIDDASASQGGLLTTEDGKVQALWVSYSTQNEKGKDYSFMSGLPSALVKPTLDKFMHGEPVEFRGIDVEMWTMRIAAARTLGLSDEWVRRIEQSGSTRHTLLYVLNILDERSPSAQVLNVGDIVLSINGELVMRMSHLMRLQDQTNVKMVLLRNGKEIEVEVPLHAYAECETARVIGWQGALIQKPYKAVLEQVRNVPQGVYVSCTLYGSPASNVLRPGVWIVEVNGHPVSDLDSFLRVVHADEEQISRSHSRRSSYIPPNRRSMEESELLKMSEKEVLKEDLDDDDDDNNDEGYIRIKTVSRNETVRVAALKLDLHYWNTWQLVKDDSQVCGWRCESA